MEEFQKKSLKLTFPRILPEKNITNYLRSTSHLKNVEYRSNEKDSLAPDPKLSFSRALRRLKTTNKVLQERRELAADVQNLLHAQWDEILEKEQKLKDTFVKLSAFVKSNTEKRERAQQSKTANQVLNDRRTQQIQQIKENIASITTSKKEMDAIVSSLWFYNKFLEEACSKSDGEFNNSYDLVKRYESLNDTKKDLVAKQRVGMEEMEMSRSKTTKMVEDYKYKILGLNTVVADLHARYNAAYQKAHRWENVVLLIRKHMHEKNNEVYKVKTACYNTYVMMCKRKNESLKIAENDFEGQLRYIKKTLQTLNNVITGLVSEGHFRLGKV